jgi:hypothetical protein
MDFFCLSSFPAAFHYRWWRRSNLCLRVQKVSDIPIVSAKMAIKYPLLGHRLSKSLEFAMTIVRATLFITSSLAMVVLLQRHQVRSQHLLKVRRTLHISFGWNLRYGLHIAIVPLLLLKTTSWWISSWILITRWKSHHDSPYPGMWKKYSQWVVWRSLKFSRCAMLFFFCSLSWHQLRHIPGNSIFVPTDGHHQM